MSAPEPTELEILRQIPGHGSVTLAGEEAAPEDATGPPLVLLHGLTATRRNVVHGSRHLARHGRRVIAYDARGHGASSPAPDRERYEYADLVGDLEAVLDRLELERPVLVGSSMGAATAMALALSSPERVAALVQITPAHTGESRDDGGRWGRLADALEHDGIGAFVEVAQPDDLPDRWRELAREATRQRMERHQTLGAVVEALRVVPQSIAFDGLDALERMNLPTLVVGSRDEPDPFHPLAVAREYAERLPRAELMVEEEGESPLAWQGARLSGVIGDFVERSAQE
jgi:pimeloyl-ACP methyl ester carboxylesterase